MPDQSVHLADFRKGKHRLFCHASIYRGREVLEGEVTQALPVNNAQVVFYVTTTGSYLDIQGGFRVDIYAADGVSFKGRTRIRYGNTITPNTLPIRETSPASIVFAPGDIVRVYRDVRLLEKLPAALETFPPDGEPYSDQTDLFRPMVGSGGAYAGWTRMLPAVMTNTSRTVDPDSGGGLTHAWDADGLSYASGSSSSANPTFTGAAGEYCPSHTATDSDNSKSSTQFVPVILHDATNRPYRVQLEDLPNSQERGGAARVRFLDNVPFDPADDGALIILWKEEWIAGTRQSFGARAPGRSHVLLVGIIRAEEGAFDSGDGVESLTFEVISPLARLEELMGYGHVMIRNASPTIWNQVRALTVGIGMDLLVQLYSTLNEAGYDFVRTSTFEDYAYSGFFLEQSTPLGQLRELANGVECRFIEDRRGGFEIQMIPERMALADRAGLPVTLTLSKRDVKEWGYTRQHWKPVNRLEMRGFIAGASDNAPVFSVYPGDAPGWGNQQTTEEKKIVLSQAHLNECAGRAGGALDGVFYDANGVQQMALDLNLVLRGVYDVFDLYDELIELDWTTLRRGLDLSAQQYVLVSSNVSFHDGTAETTLRLRTCTHAPAGTTFVPPTNADVPIIDWTPPTPVVPPTFPILPAHSAQRIALISIGGVNLTTNFQTPAVAGGPHYVPYTQPWGGTLLQWCPNGFEPGKGWIVTTTQVGYLTLATGAYTVKHTFAATSSQRSIDASFAESGFVAVVSYYPGGGGTKVLHSVDNTTFTETTVHSYDGAASIALGCYVSSKTAGKIVVGAQTSSSTSAAYLSSNHGSNWAALSPAFHASYLPFWHIHAPWNNNPSDDIYYYSSANASQNEAVWRNVGATITDVSPTISGNKYTPVVTRNGIETSVLNRQRVLMVGERDTGSFADVAAFLSNDGGASSTVIEQNTNLRRCALAGDDANTSWLWGLNGLLEQLSISGSTVTRDDRSGDYDAVTYGEIIGFGGY